MDDDLRQLQIAEPLNNPMIASVLWKMTPASMATRLSSGRWRSAPHLELLSRKMVDVAMGKCRRLLVTLPPRHGKSEFISHWFPVWYLEMFPQNRIILCSYESEFAAKWGGKVRDEILEHQDLLTIKFKTNNPAMHNWELRAGGGMFCAGVGGPITGKGANLFIIDDFVKNSEEASSKTIRDKTWDWWTSTARTRLEPGASVVILCTRWNEDDLIGRLISKQVEASKGEKEEWEVITFPALAEKEAEEHYLSRGVKTNAVRLSALTSPIKPSRNDDGWRDILGRKRGDALWPERYDERDMNFIRGAVGERDWYALYQQRPSDEAVDGNVYFSFDEKVHVADMPFDERSQLVWSMDFNVDPMAGVIAQYDRGWAHGREMMTRAWVLEEIVQPNSNTYKMCEELVSRLSHYRARTQNGRIYLEVFGDAAGRQRASASTKSNWQIVRNFLDMQSGWLSYRFLIKSANPLIADRVNSINSMLRSAAGNVRMWINPQCKELIEDLRKVRWQVDSSGNTKTQLDKSNPKRTHVSDAFGYFVEYKFGMASKGGAKTGWMQ